MISQKRRRRFSRLLFTMTFTTAILVTDVVGTMPGNAISTGLRQAFANALPESFTEGLNQVLGDTALPTLPAPIPVEAPVFTMPEILSDLLAPEPETTGASATAGIAPVGPTATMAIQTPLPDPVQVWALDFDVGTDYYTIEIQDGGYVVTFIDQAGVAFTPVDSQSWDGTTLTFVYYYPPSEMTLTLEIQIADLNVEFLNATLYKVWPDNSEMVEVELYRSTATFPPTATFATTATAIMTATAAATPPPGSSQGTVRQNTLCHTGPDLIYSWVTRLTSGQTVTVTGITTDGLWLQIVQPNKSSAKCWARTETITLSVDSAGLPNPPVPPTPTATSVSPTTTPVPPTATPIPTPTG